MVINKTTLAGLLLGCSSLPVCATAASREAASPSTCQAAATQPPIASAKATLADNPSDLRAEFKLADAWSDAGCFNEAVQVLQTASTLHSGNQELDTRLRVAKSLVGEEGFFDNIDRADDQAKLKRDIFRCSTLSDLAACNEAVRMKSDDPAVLVAQGDALVREKRPAEALTRYRHASALAPDQAEIAAKITAAEAQLPTAPELADAGNPADAGHSAKTPVGNTKTPAVNKAPSLRVADTETPPVRHYSNAAPESRSH